MSILFPFGLEEGCFAHEKFQLGCVLDNNIIVLDRGHGAKYQVTNLSVDGGYLNVTSMLNDSSSSDDEMLIYHTMNGEFGADIREDIMKGFSEFSQEFDIRMRWAVTNLTCESASQRSTTYACISAHSECV